MRVLENIHRMKKQKLVSIILLLAILIYSIIFAGLFYSLSVSVFKTVGSISIPDKVLLISLVPENPSLRASYRISNKGFSDISNIIIDFKLDLNYFELDNENETRENLFFKSEKINRINPWQNYESSIEGGPEYFNTTNLFYFWNNVDLNKPFFYILNIKFTGKYCLGIIPFKLIIKDLNPECPSCEV